MAGKRTLRTKYFTYIEVVVFIIVAFFGRRLLDAWLLSLAFPDLVNTLLRQIGVKGPAWLTDPRFALLAVILVGVWKRVGFNMVIFLAGLQTIPRTYYEAAMVDGANTRAQFRYITLPMLAPTTLLVAIMSLIDAFLVFDTVFVMSNGTGGPVGSTEVLGFILWREAFRYFNLGDASAVGWVLFFIVLLVTVIQWRVFGTSGRSSV